MSAAEQQDADALTGNKAATSLPAAPEDSAVNRARRYALGLRQRLVRDARKRRMRRKLKRAFGTSRARWRRLRQTPKFRNAVPTKTPPVAAGRPPATDMVALAPSI